MFNSEILKNLQKNHLLDTNKKIIIVRKQSKTTVAITEATKAHIRNATDNGISN
jgi:hypothetical protein